MQSFPSKKQIENPITPHKHTRAQTLKIMQKDYTKCDVVNYYLIDLPRMAITASLEPNNHVG
jgi:hypothetical protein